MLKFRWWQWLPFWRWRVVGVVDDADLVPDQLPRHAAVVVGSPSFAKWIVFDCACGSGHRIMLNLDGGRRPSWRVTEAKPLSITPSIDFDGARRCHYFIRNGRIEWARDSDR